MVTTGLRRKQLSLLFAGLLLLVIGFVPTTTAHAATPDVRAKTYTNPIRPKITAGGTVDDCPDPAITKGQTQGDSNWYMFCTSDPLNNNDKNQAETDYNFHKISMYSSPDIINWTYVGDAFNDTNAPTYAMSNSGFWAPDIRYFNNKYYLYFTVTDTKDAACPNGGGSSIGVATSNSPTGPWTATNAPVVAPRANGPATNCNFFWTFDPALTSDEFGALYIYYGSYYGGIQVRPLAANGTTTTDPASAVQITIPNRYEGAYIVKHDNYYYLFGSAGNCCNGSVTGYSVFAGRSTSPTGPFVDREGVSLNIGRVGGTPVLQQNGNRWIGTGHNAVFTDANGQDFILYHAVDRNDAYFPNLTNRTNLTKRPVLMDRLDWINEWPTTRGGLGPSDTPQPAPATVATRGKPLTVRATRDDRPGKLLAAYSDEFNTTALASKWAWVRQPSQATSYGFDNDGTFRFDTQQNKDLYQNNNSASILTETAPTGNYMVETRVRLDVPRDDCCFNFTQAGVLVYKGDDEYVKLAHFSNYETRQIEFGKEFIEPGGGAHFGGTLVGPPDLWTYLRIAKRTADGVETYTPYSSRDGIHWTRGGTWTHALGKTAKIGLVAMVQLTDPNVSTPPFHANFDYVRVYSLK